MLCYFVQSRKVKNEAALVRVVLFCLEQILNGVTYIQAYMASYKEKGLQKNKNNNNKEEFSCSFLTLMA